MSDGQPPPGALGLDRAEQPSPVSGFPPSPPPRHRGRLLFAIIAVVVVAGVVIALVVVPVVPRTQMFNLSRNLPTGTTYFNGYFGCGSNVTITHPFPANGVVTYDLTQNESDATVNVWILGPGASYSFVSTGGPGSGVGTFTTGNGQITVVLKACGPGPTVGLGFWGSTQYRIPVL